MDKENSTPSLSGHVRVLIAGGFSDETLPLVESFLNEGINICGIIAHRKVVKLSDGKLTVPLWFYDQLEDPSLKSAQTNVHDQYETCLRSILSDPRTAYFCERSFEGKDYNSVFNHTVQVELACWNSLAILKETSPDRLVYMNVTHRLTTWIFGRCADYLGIPTYFTVRSPLPWRYWAVKGIDEQEVVNLNLDTDDERSHSDNISSKTVQFVEKVMQSYKVGMPACHQEKLLRSGGRIWSWKREIKQTLSWRPVKFTSNFLRLKGKYELFKMYTRLSKPTRLSDPYIVFFLHYQPEATTLPRGRGYVQQWLAVRALAAALPDGCKLVVKEHPAIFLTPIKKYTRNKSLYEAIAWLPQVILTTIEEDPFKLIDSSMAVVTITGTAGFEAICRGRPVLIFGAAAYRDCPGAFAVNDIEQISKALQIIMSGKANPTKEKLFEYLNWVERNSVGGNSQDGVSKTDLKPKIWERLIRAEIEPSIVSFVEK